MNFFRNLFRGRLKPVSRAPEGQITPKILIVRHDQQVHEGEDLPAFEIREVDEDPLKVGRSVPGQESRVNHVILGNDTYSRFMLDIKKEGNDLKVQTHKLRLSHHVFLDGKRVATLNQGKTFRFGPGQTIVLRQGINPQTTIHHLTREDADDLDRRGWETPTYDDLRNINVNPILKSFAREKGLISKDLR